MQGSVEGKQKIVVAVSIAAVIALCAFIFFMSAQPAVDSDVMSLDVAAQLARLLIPGFDAMSLEQQQEMLGLLNHPVRKWAHFTEFALLGALTFNCVFQVARARRIGLKAANEGAEQTECTAHSEHAECARQPEHLGHPERAEQAERAERPAHLEQAGQPASPEQAEQAECAAQPQHAECAECVEQPSRSGRTCYPEQPKERFQRLFGLAAVAWAAATLYAVTDEIHQLFVPGRACMVTDVCIDSAGVLTGVVLAAIVLSIVERRSVSRKENQRRT